MRCKLIRQYKSSRNGGGGQLSSSLPFLSQLVLSSFNLRTPVHSSYFVCVFELIVSYHWSWRLRSSEHGSVQPWLNLHGHQLLEEKFAGVGDLDLADVFG